MGKITNVSRRLIHFGDTMLIPSMAVEMDDEAMQNPHIQRLIKEGALQEGEVEVRPEVDQDGDGTDETGTRPAANAPATKPPVPPAKAQDVGQKAATSPAGAAKA